MATVARVDGLRELRRDLRRLDPLVDKELRQSIRQASLKVRVEAAALAPRRTGQLAASLRTSVTLRGAAIYSNLPYAPVVHWGGTIAPRGVPIEFRRTEFITRALEAQTSALVEDIGDAVETAAHHVGWRY